MTTKVDTNPNRGSVAAIHIEGLSFTYPDGAQVLRNVNLTVERGEKVALVGANGAGKTTLVLHLNGTIKGDGIVEIFGRNVTTANRRALTDIRTQCGLIFQAADDQLFSPTVMDDVLFGPLNMGMSRELATASAETALKTLNIEHLASRMPHQLSGGEKRKAAIATVLSMNPDIIAADEPTADLDPRAKRNLAELLGNLSQTIFVATHDYELIKRVFVRCLVMHNGTIVCEGTPEEILSDKSLLERWGL